MSIIIPYKKQIKTTHRDIIAAGRLVFSQGPTLSWWSKLIMYDADLGKHSIDSLPHSIFRRWNFYHYSEDSKPYTHEDEWNLREITNSESRKSTSTLCQETKVFRKISHRLNSFRKTTTLKYNKTPLAEKYGAMRESSRWPRRLPASARYIFNNEYKFQRLNTPETVRPV